MINRLLALPLTLNIARVVAAYVVYSTKGIEGCGGDTHLVTVSGDTATYAPRDIIDEMERLFKAYDGIEAHAFYYAAGYSKPSDEVKNLNAWLCSLRSDFEKLAAKM